MGDITDAIDRIAGGTAGSPTAANTGAAYLNNPKNRPAIMADAARIAAMRPGAAPTQASPVTPAQNGGDSITGAIDRIAKGATASPQMAQSPVSHGGVAGIPNTAAPGPGARPIPGIVDQLLGAPDLIATGVTNLVGGIAGGATRLVMAKVGDDMGKDSPSQIYSAAKSAGDAVQDRLTWKPHTQTVTNLISDVAGAASKAKNALMASPVGPALSSVGDAYTNTFVKGASNPLMATVNDMVPGVVANVVAGKAGGAVLDLAKGVPGQVSAVAKTAAGKMKAVSDEAKAVTREASIANGRATPDPAPTPAAPASTLAGVGAASANMNPYPSLTGEVAARGGSSAFPQVKLSQIQKDVPLDEQSVRAKIANEVLGDEHGAVREGVITGNEDTLRSEHTQARSSENTPSQLVLRNQIAKEQQALTDYAQARVEATGTNPNLINNEQRGQVINDAFHGEGGLTDYFKQAKQQIYDRAKAESGGNPIETNHVDGLLSDPQFMAEAERNGHTSVVSGAQKLIDLARTTGFKDPITGEVHAPGSVAAWDAVRKSNNAGWSPDNARTIAAINRAIDQDVSSAAGSDAYKLGDAIHKAEKTIMDTPAIKKIFGGTDANGIKDGAALEDLPKRLNNMPIDQWKHVHNTLDDLAHGRVYGAPEGMPPVPDELKQAAAAARNEMAGALAREVFEQGAGKAGVWNQNSANKVLNSKIGQKMLQTFPPDEIQRLHALNLAGQIMPGMHSYEGGAQQALRLGKQTLTEKLAGKAGAFTGGAVGAIINPYAAGTGAQTGKWVGDKIAGRSAAKRMEGESNKLLEAMRSNSRLGQGNQGNRLSN